jgi:DNA polymerase III delta subunit
MLYILYGTDTAKVRTKAHSLIDTLQKKRPDAEVFYIDSESFSEEGLKEFVQSQGLFSPKYIVVLSRVFENKHAKQQVLDRAVQLGEAEHVFLLIEEVLDAKELKVLEKHAAQVVAYDAVKKEKQSFNTFALADALGQRDKKKLWLLYTQAKESGVADEEIHGVLWWQMKSIILAHSTKTASETGLKPFVFSKAKRFAANFSKDEANKTLTDLMAIYHESRRGTHDLGTALEAWILK